MNRTCKTCGATKPLEQFAKAGVVKGKLYYRHLCVKCYSASKKPRRDEIKAWWEEFKKTQKCAHCGNNDFRVLVFHHHNGDKSFAIGIATNRGFSKARIMAEAKKCTVLCCNCHAIVHYEERGV